MNKTLKKLLAATAVFAVTGTGVVTANAQTTYDQAFFEELAQANKEFSASKAEGTVKVSGVSADQSADFGQLSFTTAFNAEPLQLSFDGSVTSLFLGGQTLPFSAYYKDSIGYLGTPNGEDNTTIWQAIDMSEQEKEVLDNYKKMVEQLTNQNVLWSAEVATKYNDISETDTEYVVALKQDINAEELWADINSQIDMEALKQHVIEQVERQTGETIDDAARAQIDAAYSADTLAKFLSYNPVVEVSYNKETKLVSKVVMQVTINTAEFAGTTSESESGLPEMIKVDITVNLSDHNVANEVVVPEEALSAEVTTPTTAE